MPVSHGVTAPAHLLTNSGGRYTLDGEAKGWSAIAWVSESVNSHRGNLLETSKHAIGQRHLVIADRLHRVMQRPTPVSFGARPSAHVFKIFDGGHKAGDVFINIGPDLELVRRSVRNE